MIGAVADLERAAVTTTPHVHKRHSRGHRVGVSDDAARSGPGSRLHRRFRIHPYQAQAQASASASRSRILWSMMHVTCPCQVWAGRSPGRPGSRCAMWTRVDPPPGVPRPCISWSDVSDSEAPVASHTNPLFSTSIYDATGAERQHPSRSAGHPAENVPWSNPTPALAPGARPPAQPIPPWGAAQSLRHVPRAPRSTR